LLLPGADMNIQALGIIPGPGFEIAHVKDERLSSRPTAGFSAALTVGDFIFVPGLTSSAKGDEPHRNGVAKAALLADGQQWAGQPIKVETEFLIRQRIMPSLALAGATIDDIIHAQVYLTDPEDYSAFNETWSRHFAKTRPSLSIIPIAPHGLASYDGTIEINVLAAKPGSAAQKRHVDAGVPTAFRHQPQAVKAGDLLFMSAQMAIDSDGRLIAAAKDARQARFGSRAQVQAEHIIDNIEKLCRAAGTSLHNIVRVLQFHTDLDEFYPVYQVWERRLGGRPLPFSAVEVPAPLPTPGATLMIEAWAYVP
jgi:enamine deaminase RidA (YjgF/YER057c/UK114 family)